MADATSLGPTATASETDVETDLEDDDVGRPVVASATAGNTGKAALNAKQRCHKCLFCIDRQMLCVPSCFARMELT